MRTKPRTLPARKNRTQRRQTHGRTTRRLLLAAALLGGVLTGTTTQAQRLESIGAGAGDDFWIGAPIPDGSAGQSFNSVVDNSGWVPTLIETNGTVFGDGSTFMQDLEVRESNAVVLENFNSTGSISVGGNLILKDSTVREILGSTYDSDAAGRPLPNGDVTDSGSQRLVVDNSTVDSIDLRRRDDVLVLRDSTVGLIDLARKNDMLVLEGNNTLMQGIDLAEGVDVVIDRGGALTNWVSGGFTPTFDPLVETDITTLGDAWIFQGVTKEYDYLNILSFERIALTEGSNITFGPFNALPANMVYIDETSTAIVGDSVAFSFIGGNPSIGVDTMLVANDGVISMADNNAFGLFDIDGDYVSNTGGTIRMDAELADELTDLLVIGGDVRGTTELEFTEIGATPASLTDPFEILVVEVAGTSEGTFTTSGVDGFAGEVELAMLADGNWYLRNRFIDGLPVLDSAIPSVLGMVAGSNFAASDRMNKPRDRMARLRNFAGNNRLSPLSTCPFCQEFNTRVPRRLAGWDAWFDQDYHHFESRVGSGANFRSVASVSNLGFDRLFDPGVGDDTQAIVGIHGGIGAGNFRSLGRFGNFASDQRSIDNDSYSVGGYSSIWNDQYYLSGIVQGFWDDFEEGRNSVADGRSFAFAAEAGYTWLKTRRWFLQPHVQLAYTATELSDLNSEFASAPTRVDDFDSFVSRLGIRVDRSLGDRWLLTSQVDYLQEFLGDSSVTSGSIVQGIDFGGPRGEFALGLSGNLTDALRVNLNGVARWGEDFTASVANLGVTARF